MSKKNKVLIIFGAILLVLSIYFIIKGLAVCATTFILGLAFLYMGIHNARYAKSKKYITGVFYASKPIFNKYDAWGDDFLNDSPQEREYHILRFFENGEVIDVSTRSRHFSDDWPGISIRFNRPWESFGKYILISNNLKFSITSTKGTVDYSGAYLGDKLILSHYDHINKYQSGEIEYLCLQEVNTKDD
jgi:hypothetical protein